VTDTADNLTQCQYDPTFHHVTQEISYPEGERTSTTVNTYNPATGDLLTSTTDYGTNAAATTTDVWAGGLVQTGKNQGKKSKGTRRRDSNSVGRECVVV
jgi:hypothetical protein